MRNNNTKRNFSRSFIQVFTLLIATSFFFSACNDDDVPPPDNVLEFQNEILGLGESETSIEFPIVISRALTTDVTLSINVEALNVNYDQFTTEPAIENKTLSVVILEGTTSATIKLSKVGGYEVFGDERITFTVVNAPEPLVLGERSVLTVAFADLVSSGDVLNPQVGGPQQPNLVFIDLSSARQVSVARNSWDLGFAVEDGTFRVILNYSTGMLARSLNKNSLNEVNAQDTVGFGRQLSTSAIMNSVMTGQLPEWLSQSAGWIDDPAGNLSNTAIAEVAANENDNRVYIINRGINPDGSARGWRKVRVLRAGSNYVVQHAEINASSFQTLQVTRQPGYNFSYIHFDNGVVSVEPPRSRWDIAFTMFTNAIPQPQGSSTILLPYFFADMVIQNRYNTETAMIMNSSGVTYDNMTEANIAGLQFGRSQINIGSSWRSLGGGPGGGTATLLTDRFYVVKDYDGNIYKLRITALTQNGERGRPRIEYALLRAGS